MSIARICILAALTLSLVDTSDFDISPADICPEIRNLATNAPLAKKWRFE
jgi:hypothetical protein